MLTFKIADSDKDIQSIAQKAEMIWKEYFPSIISTQQIDYMLKQFLSVEAITRAIHTDGYEFYSVYQDEMMIGFFSIKKEMQKMFLSKLYIEKKFRGNGYARMMLNYIEDVTKAAGLDTIWLTCNKENEHTLAVYKKMGFVIFDEAVNDIGHDYVMDDYYLQKQI